jgi:hypothetical protein
MPRRATCAHAKSGDARIHDPDRSTRPVRQNANQPSLPSSRGGIADVRVLSLVDLRGENRMRMPRALAVFLEPCPAQSYATACITHPLWHKYRWLTNI